MHDIIMHKTRATLFLKIQQKLVNPSIEKNRNNILETIDSFGKLILYEIWINGEIIASIAIMHMVFKKGNLVVFFNKSICFTSTAIQKITDMDYEIPCCGQIQFSRIPRGVNDPTHEATPRHIKAGRNLIRKRVGPTKNLLWNDKEAPSKNQRHYGFLLVYFVFQSKRLIEIWPVYTFFCWNNRYKELETGGSTMGDTQSRILIYHSFSFFSSQFSITLKIFNEGTIVKVNATVKKDGAIFGQVIWCRESESILKSSCVIWCALKTG